MKWKPISESTNPYWDKANLYYKEKHQTVEEWVHANVPKSYWEPSLRWIEKHWHVEPTDRIDLLDE